MSGELTVAGKMAASRCEVIAPNGGTYDFGKLTTDQSTAGVVPAPMTQTWQVRCDGATYLAVEPEDNRAGTASRADAAHFGLGGDAARPLGYYRLTLSKAQIDRAPAVAYTAGQALSQAGGMSLMSGVRTQWQMPDNTARAGRQFAVDITVAPWLTQQSASLSDVVKLDGSVTMNFIFGL
ncbi:hypothetical protein [Serratia ureilytica]|uniref:hypothetical protein n=1 Tax=Serratia ureilytica TaxID=300181 RepID=UPI0018D765BD|nr:hypothetical protein [Serratia ureilytica]MBH3008173.1 hypothetical protein [Serratia ureilytica]MBH3022813.1 hypothetical protein [Serratia ureilytica]MBH3108692.1 hypothetical protein [Serratia ureilytica]MBH3176086.1 hypothetical protein [Serratia ureilytica]QQU62262.1 hypothetical protein I6I46_19560 [Serratia ureilytica]